MPLTLDALKSRMGAVVDELAPQLVAVSRDIHAHPELGFAEEHAHDVLAGVLEDAGLRVERSAHGLATAFRAEAGSEGPQVAVCCEYDALPAIGHACGHNVIAAAGLGAGLAAAALADEAGGRVLVMGTPAEEGGGGKQMLIDAGAFTDVDAALMVHPADADLRGMETLAIQHGTVSYRGRAAHAAAAPHEGRNALDAAVLGYVNVAALRQHIRPSERVHGIFLEAGTAANVVPSQAVAEWFVRSGDRAGLAELTERVESCLRAGAEAAGCEVEIDWYRPAYDEMRDVEALVDLYVANAARLGRDVRRPGRDGAGSVVGSTDMGNLSQVVPSMHPMIAVAPTGVAIHTPEFALHAGGDGGDRAVVDGAKAMAWTIADLWLDDAARGRVGAGFRATEG